MRKLAASLVLFLAWGCGSSSPNAPEEPKLLIGPIAIESLELVHGEPSPAGNRVLGVHIRGVVGDGCTTLREPILQIREGSTVTIKIEKERPADAVCSQIARLYDAVMPLVGEYPPGQYLVRVNDRNLAFSTP